MGVLKNTLGSSCEGSVGVVSIPAGESVKGVLDVVYKWKHYREDRETPKRRRS